MKKKSNAVQCLAMISQFALNMLVPIGMCFGIGYLIDRLLGTRFFCIIFFFLGAVSGFWSIYKLTIKIQTQSQETDSYEYSRKKLRDNKEAPR